MDCKRGRSDRPLFLVRSVATGCCLGWRLPWQVPALFAICQHPRMCQFRPSNADGRVHDSTLLSLNDATWEW
jgi:hypothetical protein